MLKKRILCVVLNKSGTKTFRCKTTYNHKVNKLGIVVQRFKKVLIHSEYELIPGEKIYCEQKAPESKKKIYRYVDKKE